MSESQGSPRIRHLHEEQLGVDCDLTMLLARNGTAAMWLGGFIAYAGGFDFIHFGVCRDPAGLATHTRQGDPILGLRLGDGRELICRGMPFGSGTVVKPFLRVIWGSWNTGRWMFVWSVRPLPPPGSMTFVYGWPDADIPQANHDIDADPILAAAARAIPLWGRR
jgi:hypothetical protein